MNEPAHLDRGVGPAAAVAEPAADTPLRDCAQAYAHVYDSALSFGRQDLVGVEVEWLTAHGERRPSAERLAAALGPHAPRTVDPTSPARALPGGSTITVEPGGQLELASVPRADPAAVAAAVDADRAVLAGLLAPCGIRLVERAFDGARTPQAVLEHPRYRAMADRFASIGPCGAQMMFNTAALQISVDAGPDPATAAARWALLEEAGPALIAAFADSPGPGRRPGRPPGVGAAETGWASNRQRTWLALDPARTGFARPAPTGDPRADYAAWALSAPLLCRRGSGPDWTVAPISFADWIGGHRDGPSAPPTIADLDYHLTTLFPPVRARGHLEVRYLDAQPAADRFVPLAALTALLADPAVIDRARAVVAPVEGRWRAAARHGLADPDLRRAAAGLLSLAAAETADAAAGESLARAARRCRAGAAPSADALRTRLAGELNRSHRRIDALADLPEAELTAQYSPLMSPLVWDQAHVAVQEDLWIGRAAAGREPTPVPGRRSAELDRLYDAADNPRAGRAALPLLSAAQTRALTDAVRTRTAEVLDACTFTDTLTADGFAFAMIAQHEQQHAETMLATHQLRAGPPVLTAPPAPRRAAGPAPTADAEIVIAAGPLMMGTDTDPWALDNERPAHRVEVAAFAIDAYPVTNARWAAFIADGGYRRAGLWSAAGDRHRREAGLVAPAFWARNTDAGPIDPADPCAGWSRRVFGRWQRLVADEPVVHVSFYEAQAFARWAGRRLPTEAEWEKAARLDPHTGAERRHPWGDGPATADRANLGQRHLGPAAIGAYPGGASPAGVHHLLGDVWEWTDSPFTPYPGFAPFPYRAYSQDHFSGPHRVLRGGSFGTDPVACRGTFRNWDLPQRRQIFAGVRCARSL